MINDLGLLNSSMAFRFWNLKFNALGRYPTLRQAQGKRGRALRCKSALVPRCGLSTAIPNAGVFAC